MTNCPPGWRKYYRNTLSTRNSSFIPKLSIEDLNLSFAYTQLFYYSNIMISGLVNKKDCVEKLNSLLR